MTSFIVDRQAVEKLRKIAGYKSDRALATAASVHHNTLGNILNGEPWKSSTIVKLAVTLHCSPEDITVAAGFETLEEENE